MLCRVYVLNSEIVFWPDRKLLSFEQNSQKVIALTGPASRCLELMVSKMELVTQDELYQYGWSGASFTPSPNTLYQCISVLRRALKDFDDETSFILTETRKGFRFNPEVSVSAEEREVTDEQKRNELLVKNSKDDVQKKDDTLKKTLEISNANIFYIVFGVFIFTLCATYLFYNNQFINDEIFTDYYKKDFKHNTNCSIYLSPQSRGYSLSEQVLSRLSCREKPFNYITTYPYSSTVSIISCDKSIDSHPDNCSALYLRNKNEK